VVAGWWDWLIDGSCWFAGVVAGFFVYYAFPFALFFFLFRNYVYPIHN
jgi:hypothetical protein